MKKSRRFGGILSNLIARINGCLEIPFLISGSCSRFWLWLRLLKENKILNHFKIIFFLDFMTVRGGDNEHPPLPFGPMLRAERLGVEYIMRFPCLVHYP